MDDADKRRLEELHEEIHGNGEPGLKSDMRVIELRLTAIERTLRLVQGLLVSVLGFLITHILSTLLQKP